MCVEIENLVLDKVVLQAWAERDLKTLVWQLRFGLFPNSSNRVETDSFPEPVHWLQTPQLWYEAPVGI